MGKVIGIDLGSHELKIAEWNGSAVTALATVETPDNLVRNGHVISYEAAGDFIKKALKENGISARDCSMVIPEGNAYLVRTVVPKMTEEKLRVNLPYEFRDFLTEDKAKYYYDYTVNKEIKDEEGNVAQMDITVAAVQKELIYSYRFMCRRAGLTMKYAVPAELAYSNLIRRSPEADPEKEYAFLDFGHVSTRLSIFTGSVYEVSRIIDTGLSRVDAGIAESENVDEHIAHTYKETNYNNLTESEAALNVFNYITTEARRAINFYTLNNRESNLSDIYICGGGSMIPALKRIAQENIEGTVHEASELYPTVLKSQENASIYALAIGAAMQDKTVNLAQKEKSQFRMQIVVPLVLGILVLAAVFAKFAVIDRFNELDRYNSQWHQAKDRVVKLTEQTADYDEVVDEYNKYSTHWMTDEERSMVKRMDILALIESTLQPSAKILNFTSDKTTVTAELSRLTLNDTSKLVSLLYERPDVVSVSVYSAKSDEDAARSAQQSALSAEEFMPAPAAEDGAETETGAETGTETGAETGSQNSKEVVVSADSTIIITIAMRQVGEVEK